MSAHTANSSFTFQLPSLSYIDAKWEEPELRTAAPARRREGGFSQWLAERIAAFRVWRLNNQAAAELAGMTDRELMDIGVSRSDLTRVFDRSLNDDLRQRGIV